MYVSTTLPRIMDPLGIGRWILLVTILFVDWTIFFRRNDVPKYPSVILSPPWIGFSKRDVNNCIFYSKVHDCMFSVRIFKNVRSPEKPFLRKKHITLVYTLCALFSYWHFQKIRKNKIVLDTITTPRLDNNGFDFYYTFEVYSQIQGPFFTMLDIQKERVAIIQPTHVSSDYLAILMFNYIVFYI